MERTKEIPALSRVKWTNRIDVPLLTVDLLSSRYGVPRFVKIDVEGYEEQVLSGMSFSPDFLSIEFHTSTLDMSCRCLTRLKGYEFNLILDEEPQFVGSDWLSSAEIIDWIASYRGDKDFGDIVARRKR